MADLTANEEIHDALLRRSVYLSKYAAGVQEQVIKFLDDTEVDVQREIERRLSALVGPGGEFSNFEPDNDTLYALEQRIGEIRGAAIEQGIGNLTDDLTQLGPNEAQFIDDTFRANAPVVLDTVLPSAEVLTTLILSEPMQDRLLSDWASGLTVADQTRIMDAIRLGMTNGDTTDDIVGEVFGDAALNGSNGLMEITRRDAASIVQTAIATVTGDARGAWAEANSDIITKEIWVATLDSHTCPECQALDGQVFNVGEGDTTPAHFLCRCVRVPTLDGTLIGNRPYTTATEEQLADLSEEDRRQAVIDMTGQVPASLKYQDWLERQSPTFQDEVLGPARGDLFRNGMQLTQFVGMEGDYITLAELKGTTRNTIESLRDVGIKASGQEEAKVVEKEWIASSSVRTIDDLLANAEANDLEMRALGERIEADTGAKWKPGPIKKSDRIADKVARGKAPAQITDVVRGAFYVDTPEQAEEIVRAFGKKYPIVDETWWKTPAGYFQRVLKVLWDDGTIGEIQIAPPALFSAKAGIAKGGGGGHAMYKEWQAAVAKYGEESAEAGKLIDQMKSLYMRTSSGLDESWTSTLRKLFGEPIDRIATRLASSTLPIEEAAQLARSALEQLGALPGSPLYNASADQLVKAFTDARTAHQLLVGGRLELGLAGRLRALIGT